MANPNVFGIDRELENAYFNKQRGISIKSSIIFYDNNGKSVNCLFDSTNDTDINNVMRNFYIDSINNFTSTRSLSNKTIMIELNYSTGSKIYHILNLLCNVLSTEFNNIGKKIIILRQCCVKFLQFPKIDLDTLIIERSPSLEKISDLRSLKRLVLNGDIKLNSIFNFDIDCIEDRGFLNIQTKKLTANEYFYYGPIALILNLNNSSFLNIFGNLYTLNIVIDILSNGCDLFEYHNFGLTNKLFISANNNKLKVINIILKNFDTSERDVAKAFIEKKIGYVELDNNVIKLNITTEQLSGRIL